MPREYSHIEQYESEIIKLKEDGYKHREIGEKFWTIVNKVDRRREKSQERVSN